MSKEPCQITNDTNNNVKDMKKRPQNGVFGVCSPDRNLGLGNSAINTANATAKRSKSRIPIMFYRP